MSFIQLKSVGRQFGQRWVLKDLSFSLNAGEFVAIVGESGCGKSTLLNILAGLDPPSCGEIWIGNQRIDTMNESQRTVLRAQKIGFVFQAFHLLNHLNAWQNVALPLLLANQPIHRAQGQAEHLLSELGLAHCLNASIPTLSGGEQQRVALARALVHRPNLVLADEPTGNLDPSSALPALQLLKAQAKDHGAAVLMVTHSEQAAAIADRVVRLTNGQLR
jgi:putative ABC transport system ATP-binding protein